MTNIIILLVCGIIVHGLVIIEQDSLVGDSIESTVNIDIIQQIIS